MDSPRSSPPQVSHISKSSPPPQNGFGTAGFIVSVISVVGFGLLSIIGVGLSFMGLMRKPRGLATGGLIISILTGLAWGGVYYGIYQAYFAILGVFMPSLPASVWLHAEEQAAEIAKDLPDMNSNSGSLPTLFWESRHEERVELPVTWQRSGEDILVTVASAPPLPIGMKPVSATFRVIPDGSLALGFSELREWNKINDSSLIGLFGSMYEGMMDAIEPDVESIVAWSKANEGKIPDEEEGNKLLLRFPRTLDIGKAEKFKVKSMKYQNLGNGRFALTLDFKSSNLEGTHTDSTIDAQFTRDGLLIDPLETIDELNLRSLGMEDS